mmetsp:Transcript_26023/g.77017  ORF Transcript_26023/g.77017 Transcript_26023/m.77017 type:complete len:376 (+) Transcript_26023:1061-2188(+)
MHPQPQGQRERLGGAQIRRSQSRHGRIVPHRRRSSHPRGRGTERRRSHPDHGRSLGPGGHDGPTGEGGRYRSPKFRRGDVGVDGRGRITDRPAEGIGPPRNYRRHRGTIPSGREGHSVRRAESAHDQYRPGRDDGGRYRIRRDLVRADAARVPADAGRSVRMDRREGNSDRQERRRQRRVGGEGERRHGRSRPPVRRDRHPHGQLVEHRREGQRLSRSRIRRPRRQISHRGGDGIRRHLRRRRPHHPQAFRIRLFRHRLRQIDRRRTRHHVEEYRRRVHRRSPPRARGVQHRESQVRRGDRTGVLRSAGPASVRHGPVHRRRDTRLRQEHFQPRVRGHRDPRTESHPGGGERQGQGEELEVQAGRNSHQGHYVRR